MVMRQHRTPTCGPYGLFFFKQKTAYEINLLFIAMARAAGFEANPLLLSSRRHAFFTEEYPNHEQLNALVAIVRAGGKSYILDPQSPYCPFELLPWSVTGAGGMLVDTINPRMMGTPEP